MAKQRRTLDERIQSCTTKEEEMLYNVTKTSKFSISWSNSYKYPVKIKIYPIYSITTGEAGEKDLFFDDHVGNFTAKQAIGDDIIVTKNK